MSTAERIAAARHIARYVATARERNHPHEVFDAAKMCLADWLGVAIGARAEAAAVAVTEAMASTGKGDAILLNGGRNSAPIAALVNGTLAHCLDFDDTHVGALSHLSAPTWAATLAAAGLAPASGRELLTAFIAGFETGAWIGCHGFGEAVSRRGFHATPVFGRFAAAAATAVVLRLDEEQILSALGLAATQTGGLTGSFGTMAKPFHAGKAAMDGVMAAMMAQKGFVSAHDLLDRKQGLADALVQDSSIRVDVRDLGGTWQILRNTFKPYAACLLTHPAIDAARKLHGEIGGAEIKSARARVYPLAIELAGKTTVTNGLEGKFSLAYCIALALLGHTASQQDFAPDRVGDGRVQALMRRIVTEPDGDLEKTAGELAIEMTDGRRLSAMTPLALGNPGNPMSWDDMQAKFNGLVEPELGPRASALFAVARTFDRTEGAEALSRVI